MTVFFDNTKALVVKNSAQMSPFFFVRLCSMIALIKSIKGVVE